MKLIIVLVILLGIIALAQLMRVYELSAKLRNKKEEEISLSDNKMNATFMMLFMFIFYGGFIWLMARYGAGGLGEPATEHGAKTDWLLMLNFWLIIVVFFITNTLLFVFSYKYYYREDRKAYYFPHDNKLEMAWTIVPAIVLFVIIFLGLKTWNEITDVASDDAVRVEVYSKQFGWTARYSGKDNKLGKADFRLTAYSSNNPHGVITKESLKEALTNIENEIVRLDSLIARDDRSADVVSQENYDKAVEKIDRLKRHKAKIIEFQKNQTPELDKQSYDDVDITGGEIHLIVGQEYEFTFRSQDVIHSAYIPHFRVQMNSVPGMTTRFKFIPTITTKDMRKKADVIERMKFSNEVAVKKKLRKAGDPPMQFDYILLCNKICGAGHFNMQMKIVVETEEEFNKWMKAQKTMAHTLGLIKEETTTATDEVTPPADAVEGDSLTEPVQPNNGN
jgi:cytochrome c oxidase subunit 2